MALHVDLVRESELDRVSATRWLTVSVGSLCLAGVLSLVLVVGRLPGLHALFTDPLLFRRGLVVHVNLAMVAWFYAFVAALFHLLPSRAGSNPITRAGSAIAFVGVALLIAAAGIPGAEPVLSNYIPVIDHPLFAAGLVVFAVGLLVAFLDGRLLPSNEARHGFFPLPPAARAGVRAAVVAVLLALATFAAAIRVTPHDLPRETYWEVVLWGGGHVLQFASVAAMLSAWTVLLALALGKPPVRRRTAALLFGALTLPLLAAPLLPLGGTQRVAYHHSFTELMRWGIFPVVVVYLALCVRAIVRARRSGSLTTPPLGDPRIVAFSASAALTLAGFVLGACIRGSSTVIPGHYHASIGAVTVAFMAVTQPILAALGAGLRRNGRLATLAKWQAPLFGAGQLVFALGFTWAGAYGMGRKTYAQEQVIRSTGEWLGLGVMGLGGIVAIVGGVSFLVIVLPALWRLRASRGALEEGGAAWRPTSIQSRS